MHLIDRRRCNANVAKWIEELFSDPLVEMYQMTMLFNHLFTDNPRLCLDIMRQEAERVSSILITRLFRNPNRIPADERRYTMLLFPDLPVAKKIKKTNISETNGGLHFGGFLVVPKKSRLRGTIVAHFNENKRIYAPDGGRICAIHLKEITHSPKAVAEYNTKHIMRRNFEFDHMIVLPKSVFETSPTERSWQKIVNNVRI